MDDGGLPSAAPIKSGPSPLWRDSAGRDGDGRADENGKSGANQDATLRRDA